MAKFSGYTEYHKIQRQNKLTLWANPKLAREARRLKLSNNGKANVDYLNWWLSQRTQLVEVRLENLVATNDSIAPTSI